MSKSMVFFANDVDILKAYTWNTCSPKKRKNVRCLTSDWIYLNWSCFFWILSSLWLSRLPFVRATASVSVLHQYSLISLQVTQTFPIHFLCATLSHCLILLFVSWWLMLRIINMVHNTPRDVLFFSSMLLMWPQVWGKGGYLLVAILFL